MEHKFEYQTVQMPLAALHSEIIKDFLNKAGSDGWLLVQIVGNLAILVRSKS